MNLPAFLKGKGLKFLSDEAEAYTIEVNKAFDPTRADDRIKTQPEPPGSQLPTVNDLLAIRTQSNKLQNWLEFEAQTSLLEVQQSLSNRPGIELICVTKPSSQGLVGLVRPEGFNWELLYRVAPDEVIKELVYNDLFFKYSACVSDRTIGEIMHPAALLRLNETIGEACLEFRLHQAEVLPVLDASGRIVACLRLSDLVDFWTTRHRANQPRG